MKIVYRILKLADDLNDIGKAKDADLLTGPVLNKIKEIKTKKVEKKLSALAVGYSEFVNLLANNTLESEEVSRASRTMLGRLDDAAEYNKKIDNLYRAHKHVDDYISKAKNTESKEYNAEDVLKGNGTFDASFGARDILTKIKKIRLRRAV